jgi:hypothetical protein
MDDLAAMLLANVIPVLAPRSKITALINKAYQRSSTDVDELLDGIEEDDMISLTKVIDESGGRARYREQASDHQADEHDHRSRL